MKRRATERKQRLGAAPPAEGGRHRPPAARRPLILAQIVARAVDAGFRHELPIAKRYVITAAQDGAKVHEGFWASLKGYCEANAAELVVVPFRYRNPTARKQEKRTLREQWAPELHPYLFAGRQALNNNIEIFGDIKMQPTRQSPLSGMNAISAERSMIIGHVRVELQTVPTPGHLLPKIMATTGTVTLPQYVDAVAGKIAEFHHVYAATLVEIASPELFHLRQLSATEDGSFIDLNTQYTPTQTETAMQPLAVVLGDTHVGFTEPLVDAATFGDDGIISTLAPKYIVYHDLLDGYSVNPHHNGDPFKAALKQAAGLGKVRAEIERACQYVAEKTPNWAQAVLVASNHNDFLARWMRSTDWRQLIDRDNAQLYLDTAAEMLRLGEETPSGVSCPSPFEMWAATLLPKAKILGRKESFRLGGIELSMHGDVGPNGSRGSIKNLRRIGVKSVIGHTHSPGISEGCYQVGTSSLLQLEYNQGPSGWLNTHAVVYANGKRSLISIFGGKWRLS